MSAIQTVIFFARSQMFGVDISQVQEIINYQDVEKVPGMPAYMEGMINIRGSVIPVISMHKKLGIEPSSINDETKIIITNFDNRAYGFIVDSVSEINIFMDSDIEPVPDLLYAGGNNYLQCIAKKGERLVSILNLRNILSVAEIKEVNKVT